MGPCQLNDFKKPIYTTVNQAEHPDGRPVKSYLIIILSHKMYNYNYTYFGSIDDSR